MFRCPENVWKITIFQMPRRFEFPENFRKMPRRTQVCLEFFFYRGVCQTTWRKFTWRWISFTYQTTWVLDLDQRETFRKIVANIRVLGCWQRDIPHRILPTFFIKLMMFFPMNSTSEFKARRQKLRLFRLNRFFLYILFYF